MEADRNLISGMRSSTDLFHSEMGENYIKKTQPFEASENGLKSKNKKGTATQEKSMKIQEEKQEFVVFELKWLSPFPLPAQQGRGSKLDWCSQEHRAPFSAKKSPSPAGFTGEFLQIIK